MSLLGDVEKLANEKPELRTYLVPVIKRANKRPNKADLMKQIKDHYPMKDWLGLWGKDPGKLAKKSYKEFLKYAVNAVFLGKEDVSTAFDAFEGDVLVKKQPYKKYYD